MFVFPHVARHRDEFGHLLLVHFIFTVTISAIRDMGSIQVLVSGDRFRDDGGSLVVIRRGPTACGRGDYHKDDEDQTQRCTHSPVKFGMLTCQIGVNKGEYRRNAAPHIE